MHLSPFFLAFKLQCTHTLYTMTVYTSHGICSVFFSLNSLCEKNGQTHLLCRSLTHNTSSLLLVHTIQWVSCLNRSALYHTLVCMSHIVSHCVCLTLDTSTLYHSLSTDKQISIDAVIQQLEELVPHWQAVGEAAHIQPEVMSEVSMYEIHCTVRRLFAEREANGRVCACVFASYMYMHPL